MSANTNALLTKLQSSSKQANLRKLLRNCICISQGLMISNNKISDSTSTCYSYTSKCDHVTRNLQVMKSRASFDPSIVKTNFVWSKFYIYIYIYISPTILKFPKRSHVYSPIEPAMSLFPPSARILLQFRQSEQNPTERRDELGRGKGSQSPPRHFVARSRSDKYTDNGIRAPRTLEP